MHGLKKIFKFIKFIVLAFSLFGCSNAQKSYGVEQFGDDRFYFLGLRALENGREKDAKNFFLKSKKKGTYLISRKSAEALCDIGDFQKRVGESKKLLELYDDEDAKFVAAKIYFEANETSLLLSIAKDINLYESKNELIALRLRTLLKTGNAQFEKEFTEWYLNRAFSAEHYKFFLDYSDQKKFFEKLNLSDEKKIESDYEKILYIINYRLEVYKKNYSQAFQLLPDVDKFISEKNLMTPPLISDIGKTHLYASADPLKSSQYFQKLAEEFKNTPIEFFCWFYAGRLYEKVESSKSRKINYFENAINSTDDNEKKDNALWYLFRGCLKSSTDDCVTYLKKYIPKIYNKNYFDDFFDLLSTLLLSEKRYEVFADLYKFMGENVSKETQARFAYIYARLLEEKIFIPENLNIEDEINLCFKIALNSGTDMYYKVMAANRLNLSDFEKEKFYCQVRKEDSQKLNPEVEQLLKGYAFFGFPEKIYSEWVKLGSPVLSIATTINLCKLLQNCSTGKDDYLVQSLRIAAKTANYSSVPLTLELLEYVYPKNYEEFVTKYCEKYGIQKSVLWALIRSESFFDPDVVSSAGAIGLCQLMSFTGEDIARRLRKSEYDLTDPETSIEFGAYYLDNLIGRLDGSYLDAFFSYNAGITRVRKWKKSSALGFGMKEIPEDLFLETLPYTETREYGRKLVAATEMYEWLWDKKW